MHTVFTARTRSAPTRNQARSSVPVATILFEFEFALDLMLDGFDRLRQRERV